MTATSAAPPPPRSAALAATHGHGPSDTATWQRTLERVRAKRLIFTVTTGRSGTGFLQHLLASTPGMTCLHEPTPNFVDVMRDAQTDPAAATRFWVDRKLPAIADAPSPIYAETTHLCCKGFLEPLLGLGLQPDLIVLRRSHRAVARSLYRIRTVPTRTEIGRRYLLGPDDPGVLPLADWASLHDYQLCYWYTLEIDRRAAEYAAMLRQRGAIVSTIDLEELTTFAGFRRLLGELRLPMPGLRGWARFALQRRQIVNPKRALQRDDLDSLDHDALEREVHERIDAAALGSLPLAA